MSDIAQSVESFNKAIVQAFETEKRGTRKAANPYDIPRDYDDIDPEWFTHILCRNHPDAKVIDFRAEKPDDLDRGHMRVWLTYNEAGKTAGLPASVFCKDSQNMTMRLVNSSIGMQRTEVEFFRKARHLIDNAAPTSLWANYSPYSHNSIVVFEDLLQEGAEFCTIKTSISRAQMEYQLTYLARIHSKFYRKLDQYPALAQWQSYIEMFQRVSKFFSWEDRSNKGFLASESVIPQRVFSRYRDIWPLTVKAAENHATRPSTFTHGDTHLRNWYIMPNGELGLCDWQLMSRADFSFDVIYAIVTSLNIDDRRNWYDDLLKFYVDRMHEGGAEDVRFEDVEENTCRQLLVALCSWTPAIKTREEGNTTFQPQDETLEMIRRVSTAIEDLDALNRFS